MMNKNTRSITFTLVLLISLMLSSLITTSFAAGEMTETVEEINENNAHYYDLKDKYIAVLYSEGHQLSRETGESVYDTLTQLSPNIIGLPVSNERTIQQAMDSSGIDIAIWVFPTSPEGLIIQQYSVETTHSWSTVVEWLNPDISHIFTTGNTFQLLKEVPWYYNVYGSGEERADAHQLFVYTLWTLSDVLEQRTDASWKNFGEDLRLVTLRYFSQNFNDLAARTVQPESIMGADSPETVEARKQKFYDDHPPVVEKIARDGYKIDPLTQRNVDSDGRLMTNGYGMDIFPRESSVVTDFILSFIPEETGLRGPMGGIIDVVLTFLIEVIGDALGIDSATVEGIVNALIKIPELIGAVSSGDTGKIKEFLISLKPMIPLPADMLEYFDLIVDAIFLLTGSTQDILDFISAAIDLVVPDDFNINGQTAGEFLNEVFALGAEVFDQIAAGKPAVEVILTVMNANIVKGLIKTALESAAFGWDPADVDKGVDIVVGLLGMLINLIATGDYEALITEFGVPLLDTILNEYLDLTEDQSKMIMNGVSLILAATGITDDKTIEEVLIELLATLKGVVIPDIDELGLYYTTLQMNNVDPNAIDPNVVDYETIAAAVRTIVEAIGAAAENPPGDAAGWITTVIDPLLTILELDNNIEDAIKDASLIIIAIINSDFSVGGLADIGGMVNSLLLGIGVTNAQQSEIIQMVLNGIVAIAGIIDKPETFKDVLLSVLPNDFSDLSTIFDQLLTNLLDLVSGGALNNAIMTNSQPVAIDAVTGIEVNSEAAIDALSEGFALLMQIIGTSGDNSVQGIMNTLLTGATFVLNQVLDIDIQPYVDLVKGIFGKALGLTDEVPSGAELASTLNSLIPAEFHDEVNILMKFVTLIRDIFLDGFETIFAQLTGFLASAIVELIQGISGELDALLSNKKFDLVDMDIPIGIGSFSLFTMNLKIQLSPGFEFDIEKLTGMIFDLIFKGTSIFEGATPVEILRESLSFFSLYPLLTVRLELNDFGSGESSFINFLLSTLGLELTFSGYGYFTVSLFSFKNGVFNLDDFFKIVEWGFGFKLTLSKTLTLLDFLTGGVGGGLNAIGKYIGLDAISITIAFTIGLDIVFRAASNTAPATGTMAISLGIAFTVQLGIDILVLALLLRGTFEVVLTFLQDLLAPTPLRVFISIQLTIEVEITLLFIDITITVKWSPNGYAPPLGKEITSPNPQDAVAKGALGGDTDGDGLSDEYEKKTPGLNFENPDTDGDGLDDKMETQITKTDATQADSDYDGLDDPTELDMGLDPLNPDTDYDGLNDYEEAVLIGTDPKEQDTDQDGLTDHYEVNHAWNMTQITPTVDKVIIAGVEYTDHTDPMNPDTDGDGLLDGEEGERGIYYSDALFLESEDGGEDGGYVGDPPLMFNGGYTHPLDSDTDDDSFWQLYDGSIAPVEIPFIMDMSDLKEIQGRVVTFIDPLTGIPEEPRLVRTNPVNPDTDGDTGATAQDRENPPFGFFLNGDGYELSRDPPTDPLDGDTDDDGLIDGLEGMLRPDSNHTNPLNPDTDGDGLADMQEQELGTDGRSIDTDRDGVPDGDEFFRFHTNPFLADSDFDGVEDGEEVYTYHTNPHMVDSDGDGINDYFEIFIHFSDPMDKDGDNDFLTDWEEIYLYSTDPFNSDTDGDGLFDGEEIQGWEWYDPVSNTTMNVTTNPFDPDSDDDSLMTLDQDGEISMRMNDYDEFLYGTNPNIRDSDQDGIQDGWELWLGKGKIPDMPAIPLDPLNNDTDGDKLIDGSELIVANMTTLLYPYVGYYMITPFNSSAVNNDTDGDLVNDFDEVANGWMADNPDTDNDTLSDYVEWQIWETDPGTNDTDGDGIIDPVEIFGTNGYLTDPNNSDSDGDLLPDGRELDYYTFAGNVTLDPTIRDQNGNDIWDGLEFDSDRDGLADGQEFYIYGTALYPGGGIENPDSDGDGLFDGFEVWTFGTDAANPDTDGDNYTDGIEYICGTDPLANTTAEEIAACSLQFTPFIMVSPLQTTYETNTIPVIGWDITNGDISNMRYHWRLANETEYSNWNPMHPDDVDENGHIFWRADYLNLPQENGTYVLEMEATEGGTKYFQRVTFDLLFELDKLEIISPQAKTYSFGEFDDVDLPIRVDAGLNYDAVKFRIVDNEGGIVVPNTTLTFQPGRGLWERQSQSLPDEDGTKQYYIEVFANHSSGIEIAIGKGFKIKTPTPGELIVIVAVPIAVITVVVVAQQAGVFKNPFKKEG